MNDTDTAWLQAQWCLAAAMQPDGERRHRAAVATLLRQMREDYGITLQNENACSATTFGCTDLVTKRGVKLRITTFYDEGCIRTKVAPK